MPEEIDVETALDSALVNAGRLAALERSGLLDSPVDDSFDRATRLAGQLLGVPVSLVSIVTPDRQFFKSARGLAEPWASRRETPLSHSFCQYVVTDDAPLVVEDARLHSLVSDNAAIEDLGVVAYLGVPLRDGNGETLGALCAIDDQPRAWSADDLAALEDLAESLRTELRLRAAAAELAVIARSEHAARIRRERDGDLRFTRLAENATDTIFVLALAPEPTVVFLNPAVEQLTGYTREALMADPALLAGMLGNDDRLTLQNVLDDDSRGTVELQCHHRDGTSRWVSVSTTVLTDDDGTAALVQGVVRDIDDRKRTQAALQASLEQERAAADRAARLNEMTSTFLTAISHELRTPLTSVIGFSDVLAARRAELSEGQQDHLVERLRLNAHRLRRLLEDVLDVDRLARGHLEPQPRLVRLDELVERVITEVADDDRGRVTMSVSHAAIVCDAGHLERIIANLVGNALRHTPPGTPVLISTTDSGGTLTLTVDDAGPGIPDHLKQQIFEPFVHGPQAATAASPGTGLGLTLARELAQLNRGDVAVHDRPGGGARLTVTLPTGAPASPPAA